MPRLVFIASPHQRQALLSTAPVPVLLGGTGSGKSSCGGVWSIKKVQETGLTGLIAAPELPQLASATFPALFKWCPHSMIQNYDLNHPYTLQRKLEFIRHDEIIEVHYGSLSDPESLTGISAGWGWADEIARCATRKALDVLLARLREGELPQLFCSTTPRGRNWLYEAIKKSPSLFEVIVMPTEENREHLSPGYIESLELLFTGRMREQELGGAFVATEGAVWDNLTEENVTTAAEYIEGAPVEWAVDSGFTKGHARVFLFTQTVGQYVNVFDAFMTEYTLPELDIEEVLSRPWAAPSIVYIDSSAAELKSRLWDRDIDTVSATHAVDDGIQHALPFICDGRGTRHLRFHPRARVAFDEMRLYVYDEKTGKPRKQDDNSSDALRYLLKSKDLLEMVAEDEKMKGAKKEEYDGIPVF